MAHSNGVCGVLAAVAAIVAVLAPSVFAQAAPQLKSYNVDPATVSVSGLGTGANMAIQVGVAYSSRIAGVGVFSGVPYDCFRPGNVTRSSCSADTEPDIEPLIANMRAWSGDKIDSLFRSLVEHALNSSASA